MHEIESHQNKADDVSWLLIVNWNSAMPFLKNQVHQIPISRQMRRIKTQGKCISHMIVLLGITEQNLSSLALISITNISEIGVIASLTIFSESSRAPAMIVVSS